MTFTVVVGERNKLSGELKKKNSKRVIVVLPKTLKTASKFDAISILNLLSLS